MTFVFEFIISFILIFSAYWIFRIIRSFFYNRKKIILKIILLIFFVCSFSIVFYGSFVEPWLITVKTENINITNSDKPIKIAFLTDLHVGYYLKDNFVNLVVEKTLAEKPDLVLLGGDLISGSEKNAKYLSPLEKLSKTIPTYAATGNHEYNLGKFNGKSYNDKTKEMRNLFQKINITFLDNANTTLEINGQKIFIAGLLDIWTGKADLASANTNMPDDDLKVLLCHNPDIILNSQSNNYDLILSGHTHAGQIRLPYIGSLARIPTVIGSNYEHGLYKYGKAYLFVSSGLGESGVRARLFDPPEIVILNVK